MGKFGSHFAGLHFECLEIIREFDCRTWKGKFCQMIKVLLEKRGKSKPPHESPATKNKIKINCVLSLQQRFFPSTDIVE
jgi:hypothetical protein